MNAIDSLAQAGTVTWLDDLSRDRIETGNLADIIATKSVVGVTTNPAIFAAAMSHGTAYDAQIAELKAAGTSADHAVYAMSIADVQAACDLFADIYAASGGKDGRVSIEVDPRISEDTDATLAQAKELWRTVNRPNVMIKIPATPGSLPAVTAALAEGISVNVTLIFSVVRYREVINAFVDGINQAKANGKDVSTIHSVASFFVSRLDTEVDKRLAAIGTEEALALQGKAGVANPRLAYAAFLEHLADGTKLPAGANVQRPLWASTGVKNPDYSPTLYVTELAGPNTVNTMPEATIDAVLAADNVHGDALTGTKAESEATMAALTAAGIGEKEQRKLWQALGTAYFVHHQESEILWHTAHLVHHPEQACTRIRPHPANGNMLQVMVYLPNADRLFANLCRIFSRHNLDIAAARAFITAHDYVLDTFAVRPPEGSTDDDRQRIENALSAELQDFLHGKIRNGSFSDGIRPQRKTSTAAKPYSGQVWMLMCDSAKSSTPGTPPAPPPAAAHDHRPGRPAGASGTGHHVPSTPGADLGGSAHADHRIPAGPHPAAGRLCPVRCRWPGQSRHPRQPASPGRRADAAHQARAVHPYRAGRDGPAGGPLAYRGRCHPHPAHAGHRPPDAAHGAGSGRPAGCLAATGGHQGRRRQ